MFLSPITEGTIPMDYTEEQLTQIEQYASIYLKISDMAVILGI